MAGLVRSAVSTAGAVSWPHRWRRTVGPPPAPRDGCPVGFPRPARCGPDQQAGRESLAVWCVLGRNRSLGTASTKGLRW